MRSALSILFVFHLSIATYSQDSVYVSKIDSMVRLAEDRIISLGQHMFIRNVQFENWYEEYIVDTINKHLLRVKFYRYSVDTAIAGHPDLVTGKWPIVIHSYVQSYTFYYKENQLIKIWDHTEHVSYYIKNKDFITKDKNVWRTINEAAPDYIYIKIFWFFSNRFIKHFKHLF